MNQEYISVEDHDIIVNNQAKTLGHLEVSQQAINKVIKLSDKHYSVTAQGFKDAVNTIARIRANFDSIYKNIRLIKDKAHRMGTEPKILKSSPQQ